MDNTTQKDIGLNELLIFFPINYSNFINYVFSFINEETPRIYLGVLLLLKKYGPMPISHLGEQLSIAKPNMTSLLDNISQKGWIKRIASASDRRVVNIEATEGGLSYLDETILKLNKVFRQKLSVLSGKEIEEFMQSVNLLTKLGSKVLNGGTKD